MKSLVIFLILLNINHSFAQKLRITGQVFEINRLVIHSKPDLSNPFDHGIPRDSFYIGSSDKFNIYLTDKPEENSTKKELLNNTIKPYFDIKFNLKKNKDFQYLEFRNRLHVAYAKIDTLTHSPYEIIMCFSDTTQFKYELYRKPAIYLYPETKQAITVLHDFKGTITTTYPAYNKGWKVIACPDGKLYNPADQRNYPYLFWEGAYGFPDTHYQYTEGFYIVKKDYIDFLQTKLAAIGLNDTEITDFVMFWLPVLNQNPYAFVHFRINDNIDNTSFLNIQPKPESVLRVFMEFTGMQSLQEIKRLPEQTFTPLTRKGFTVTEWGGAEIRQYDLVSKEE